MTISETSTEKIRTFVFLTMFKRGKPGENSDLFKQLFLNKPAIEDKYFKKCFSQEIEPHTAKLSLSVVLKHLGGNS